jgi:hypothetical protein
VTERIEIVVTVKAYPSVSQKYGEAVCVAGIRIDVAPVWVRLYPIQFRDLPFSQQFKKWQKISLDVKSHSGDRRPETRRPLPDTLKIGDVLPAGRTWAKRRPLVDAVRVDSMCELMRKQRKDGTSLGAFRPAEVEKLVIEKQPANWDPKKEATLKAKEIQPALFGPVGPADKPRLERVPYKFSYRYRCGDQRCKGHEQQIIDWEIAQAWRKWSAEHGSEGALRRIESKWITELCSQDRDTHLFVGNQHQHPASFLVLGVFWPPKATDALF